MPTRIYIRTEEYRRIRSEAEKGEKNHNFGKHLSEKIKEKMSEAKKGKVFGKNNPNWKGGKKLALARVEAKRRKFGFIPLNRPFNGSVAHHLDRIYVVYMNEEDHKSIWHSVLKNINMSEINALAFNYI
jgi:hypothetical protein